MKTASSRLLCAVVWAVVPGVASAGEVVAGAAASLGSPSGAFGDVAGTGFGFAASGVYHFGEGALGFRVSGTGTWYGTESLRVSGIGAAALTVDAKPTTFVMVAGPQFERRQGKARPYAHLLAGFAHFSTTVSLAGSTAGSTLSAAEFQDDVFAWSAGAGVLIPLRGRLSLDLGVRYTRTGEAEFVGASGFTRSAGGSVAPLLEREAVGAVEGIVGLTLAF
jgi:opacity protein-like surface antigen